MPIAVYWQAMRICSLLPSATEILYALGLGDQVVGVTHECDYPLEVRSKPVLTKCVFDSHRMSPAEIDQEVKRLAVEGKSLYTINDRLMAELKPDLIVTQDLCHVCAVTPTEVNRAVEKLKEKPEVVCLNPRILDDVMQDIHLVAEAAGVSPSPLLSRLKERVAKIAPACTISERPEVGCIEWLDPLWRTGHWVPGMVQLAGGQEVFGEIGKPSRSLTWEELEAKNPAVLIVMPCGFPLEKTRVEFSRCQKLYPWQNLNAIQSGSTYLVDANAYFSRSGPRLVDGLELLAEMLHPEYFRNVAPVQSYIRVS